MGTRRWGLAVALLALAALAADDIPDVTESAVNGRATINWTKGVITAVGYGPRQNDFPEGTQRMIQRRVAYVDACRVLAEAINGIHVTSETTVKEYQLVSDEIRTKVEALVQGQQVTEERIEPDGTVVVTMIAALSGSPESVAGVVLPQLPIHETAARQAVAPAVTRPVIAELPDPLPQPPGPPPPAKRSGPFTGLVVDCRGLGIQRAMSPKIVRADGSEVWGTVNVPRDVLLNRGIVGYVADLATALRSDYDRAGANPLVVRAIGRHGSFAANPVVSDEDAAQIIRENARTKFLDKLLVAFVIDP